VAQRIACNNWLSLDGAHSFVSVIVLVEQNPRRCRSMDSKWQCVCDGIYGWHVERCCRCFAAASRSSSTGLVDDRSCSSTMFVVVVMLCFILKYDTFLLLACHDGGGGPHWQARDDGPVDATNE
jgi:hypothetical protein